jgi:ribulose-phosphate 3-epimerase
MKFIISPSVICANYLNLQNDLDQILQSKKCEYLHIDIMDGSFVDQITIGSSFLEWCKKGAKSLKMDVHLMIQNPEKHVKTFAKAGADIFTYHFEVLQKNTEILMEIKKHKMKAGIAIKPNTTFEEVRGVLQENINLIDNILVCTVEPGYYGQKFMPQMLEKVRLMSEFLKTNNKQEQITIEVDGGVGLENINDCIKAGANVFVVGNAIFFNKDKGIKEAVEGLWDKIAM